MCDKCKGPLCNDCCTCGDKKKIVAAGVGLTAAMALGGFIVAKKLGLFDEESV